MSRTQATHCKTFVLSNSFHLSLQSNLFRNSCSITRTLAIWNNFVFDPNNPRVPHQGYSYREFTVVFANNAYFFKAVANASVLVTADMNIKVPVKLKLQLRRHTDTLIFASIHLMYLMI